MNALEVGAGPFWVMSVELGSFVTILLSPRQPTCGRTSICVATGASNRHMQCNNYGPLIRSEKCVDARQAVITTSKHAVGAR
jgi:hypothetical protein